MKKPRKERVFRNIDKKDVFSLIVVRLIIVTALIISAVTIQFSTSTFLLLNPFYALILVVYVLSAVYFGLYLWGKNYTYQAGLQIFLDLLIITAFVYISGGLEGSFYFLYIFAIIAAGIILSRKAAYITAALSAVCFGVLVDGMFLGLIPSYQEGEQAGFSQIGVLSNLFVAWGVFFVVAFLTSYLMGKLNRANEELRSAHRELEVKRRLAEAGEVSAYLSHEIRNPLAAISGSVQVLRDELRLTEDQQKLMNIVVKESERVSKSLDDFLSLSTDTTDEESLINLSEALKETLLLMRKSGELNGRCQVGGNFRSANIQYYGSGNQLKQIFWNLIKNSVRAMDGHGALTIDILRLPDEGIKMIFRDTGRGMSEDVKQKIFEPFYTDSHLGKGIGMAVVKRIVDNHKGTIEVSSELNNGTEVLIALPSQKLGIQSNLH
jgi:signal transduction histidine kinase